MESILTSSKIYKVSQIGTSPTIEAKKGGAISSNKLGLFKENWDESPNPNHKKHMDALKRIEGKVRGIQRMVEEKRYCVDILTQLSAVSSAVGSVQNNILERHLDTCVTKAFVGESKTEKRKKIDEVIKILKTFRKNGS